jgi:hypothetical protein
MQAMHALASLTELLIRLFQCVNRTVSTSVVRDSGAIKVAFAPGFLFAAFVLEVFSSVMGIPGAGPLSIV